MAGREAGDIACVAWRGAHLRGRRAARVVHRHRCAGAAAPGRRGRAARRPHAMATADTKVGEQESTRDHASLTHCAQPTQRGPASRHAGGEARNRKAPMSTMLLVEGLFLVRPAASSCERT